jgi:hypothetical protein
MARGTRARTPGKDDEKRKLLTSLRPSHFPSLVADILYFSKGYRQVKVMDGPGDGVRQYMLSRFALSDGAFEASYPIPAERIGPLALP